MVKTLEKRCYIYNIEDQQEQKMHELPAIFRITWRRAERTLWVWLKDFQMNPLKDGSAKPPLQFH